jgi:NADH-quinone oxidoreductase subunit N
MVAVDRFSVFFRLVILSTAALAVVLSHGYLRGAGEWRGEYYPLLLFATAGMTLIASATDLILIFLALEIFSLSLYLLTGFSLRRAASAEGAMKYFLLGAFSSAFFLYGIAMAYGAAGATNLGQIGRALEGQGANGRALGVIAVGLLATGFAFKVSLVPFHMWTPDAYQGAPTPVTAFMGAGTKVAAFAAFLRVFQVALAPLVSDWRPLLAVVAAVTVVAGSVLAIAQDDVKRMLAYSSIAHAGFILIGLSAGSQAGTRAAMFYLAAYAAMVLGGFGVVMLVSGRGERRLSLHDYRGLARREPMLAGLLTLFLVSLAGVPPTSGFIAKVTVFSAAMGAGYAWLVLVGVLASVAAAFFYLRLIVLMYSVEEDAAVEETAPVGGASRAPAMVGARVAVAVPAILTLAFGVFPGLLFGVLQSASALRL